MRSINTEIVNILSPIKPTYYELYLDGSQEIPCISYQIIQNAEVAKGNINGYSSISVRLKLWSTSVEELDSMSSDVDDALATIGRFERTTVGELTDGDLICWILDYSILIPEVYNTTRA